MEKMNSAEFYEAISRRPLIDIVPEKGEVEEQAKNMGDANDITLYSWRNPWLKNLAGNKEHFKYFNRDHSVKIYFNDLINKPIILCGAGPTLQGNIEYLKLAKEKGIPILASHHALMYLSRPEFMIKPDFAIVLDAGESWNEYFGDLEFFQDVPLLSEMCCDTEQLKRWKGPVHFFRSVHPTSGNISKYLRMEMDRIIDINESASQIEVGGHAMGAAMGIARGVMRSNTIICCGMDYCFNHQDKFYPFDHKIDLVVEGTPFGQPGVELPAPPDKSGVILDIFGKHVATNASYLSFKNIMDMGFKLNVQPTMNTQEDFEIINACEGGALGALKYGNSKWMRYMRLEDAIYYAAAKKAIPKE